MTGERKPKIGNLELYGETLRDLSEGHSDAAPGGSPRTTATRAIDEPRMMTTGFATNLPRSRDRLPSTPSPEEHRAAALALLTGALINKNPAAFQDGLTPEGLFHLPGYPEP